MAVQDKPLTPAQQSVLAEAFELQRRMGTIVQWKNEGYITVERVDKMHDYRIECAGAVFREQVRKFPSEELIAKIGLAINSGSVSEEERMKNKSKALHEHIISGNHLRDAMMYGMSLHKIDAHDQICEVTEDVYKRVAEMTRSVTKALKGEDDGSKSE